MWKEILESLQCFRDFKKTRIIVKSKSGEKFLAPRSKRIGMGGKEPANAEFSINIFHLPCDTET